MLVLAFDTSTLQGAVGWIRAYFEGPDLRVEASAECSMPARPGHAETLLERIESVLASGGHRIDEVELIVFGRGPGTFTGLRIGLSTAQGLAIARGVPLVGLSSLESLAMSAEVDGPVAPVIDARRGQIFTAVYEVAHPRGRPTATELAAERATTPKAFAEMLTEIEIEGPICLAGGGAELYRDELSNHGILLPTRASNISAYWMAVNGLEIFASTGADDPATIEPVYLREPDARLPRPR